MRSIEELGRVRGALEGCVVGEARLLEGLHLRVGTRWWSCVAGAHDEVRREGFARRAASRGARSGAFEELRRGWVSLEGCVAVGAREGGIGHGREILSKC